MLMAFVPKARDCGSHEWYRQDETVWACYHCRALTKQEPWSPIEAVELQLAALDSTIRVFADRPLNEVELHTAARLATESERAICAISTPLQGAAQRGSLTEEERKALTA